MSHSGRLARASLSRVLPRIGLGLRLRAESPAGVTDGEQSAKARADHGLLKKSGLVSSENWMMHRSVTSVPTAPPVGDDG